MPRALRPLALLLPLAVLASGCLFESTLNPDGSGVMKAFYKMPKDQTLDQQKKQFISSNMAVTKAQVEGDNMIRIEATYKDLTKLNTAPFFKNIVAAVTSDEKAGTKTIKAKLVNRNPVKLPDAVIEYFGKEWTFSLTVPGEVVKSNATSTKGNTLTWTFPLSLVAKEIPFEVTYKPAPDAKPTTGATPAK